MSSQLPPQLAPLSEPAHLSATGRPARAAEELLVATGQGDVDAFATLYEILAPRVYGLVLRTLRDRHEAEEVAQEVLLQVWQTADRFDPARGSARSWVMTLAHRRAVDRVRSGAGSRRRDAAHAVSLDLPAYDETAAAAHASLDAQLVRAALAGLTPLQRQAVELAYFGGYTHQEVSRLLRVPLGTAKARIRDGLLRLRDSFAGMYAAPA